MQKAPKKVYIESYGCAMNFSDSEIVASIMQDKGYAISTDQYDADIIFLNTCSVRDNAEKKIRNRLIHLKSNKKKNRNLLIGILGCMAERLKEKLLEEEQLVDIVAGPDAYRTLPDLIEQVDKSTKSINVLLSLEETYGDIAPVRLNDNQITAFISITRGCDNMCTFCVVPFTRGRERSRSPKTIIDEAIDLDKKGYKEITLLGQNVDSFLWYGGGPKKHFKKLTEEEKNASVNFHQLLEKVALAVPNMRIRFSTSHPKDITDEVLYTIKKYDNICNYIHLPAQSGNSRILEMMNRTYTREWYLEKVQKIREIIPGCGLSSDVIAGFCSETEAEHQDTISMMQKSKFNFSYMYKYSERPDTVAAKKYKDDIPEDVKSRRLAEIIIAQNDLSREMHKKFEGSIHNVLIEGTSKKSEDDYYGRNEQNITVVFPKENTKIGDIVAVKIIKSSSATLIGKLV